SDTASNRHRFSAGCAANIAWKRRPRDAGSSFCGAHLMRVGIIGTGAISHKHALAYRNIGYQLTACSGLDPARARRFAAQYGCELVEHWPDLCRRPDIDFVDVCTFPDVRLEPVEVCAKAKKDVQVQKP